MAHILADAEMATRIEQATGPVNVVDQAGTVIAVCTPVTFPHSPHSREEVEAARRRCRATGGKSLTELLAKLKEQHS